MRSLILPTMGNGTCWRLGPFQIRAFKFIIHCEHPAFTSWLQFPHRGGRANGGHLLAQGLSRSELSPSKLCPSPSLGSSHWGSPCLCQERWASMRTDWVLCQKQEWTFVPGKHIFRHLPENYNCFALREKPDWPLLKYYFCLVRLHFPGRCISRQEEFPQKSVTDFGAGSTCGCVEKSIEAA